MSKLKKYPIFYNNEEYEVKWKTKFDEYYNADYLVVYKVYRIYKLKFYKKIYAMQEFDIDWHLIPQHAKDKPDYHIEQVKYLFECMIPELKEQKRKELLKAQQLHSLAEWDGKIDER